MNSKCLFIIFLIIQNQIFLTTSESNAEESATVHDDVIEEENSKSVFDNVIDEENNETVSQPPPQESVTVSLEKFGKIKGFLERSSSGVPFYSYLGVPYAKPPIGPRRFKDPEGLEEWEGIRDGSIPPPPCSQIDINTFIKQPKSKYVGEEDCLYLNVFTPEPNNPDANLPVLVYIHGGHFVSGSASEYEPYDLLDAPLVLVVIQYRLGVLGFLSTEDLVIPGNFGLKDQTLAVKWVHKYIEDFGGSPLKITLMGSDAGAASVHYQMLSHKTLGLFSKAILQSGNALCPWAKGAAHKEVAYHIGKYFKCLPEDEKDEEGEEGKKDEEGAESDDKKEEILEQKSSDEEENKIEKEEKQDEEKDEKEENSDNKDEKEEEIKLKNENLLDCLRDIDVDKLALSAELFYMWSYFPVMFGPYADDRYLPEAPESLIKLARHKRVQMIIGINKDDGSHITNSLFLSEGRRMALKHHFPLVGPISLEFSDEDIAPLNMSIKAYDKYVGNLDIDAPDAQNLTKLYTDRHYSVCSDTTAQYHSINNKRYKKDIFFYVFEHRGQRSSSDAFDLNIGKDWVSHGDELYYLFPFNKTKENFRNEDDEKMKKLFLRMWYSFAEHGNPTPLDAFDFTWNPYTAENKTHLRLSLEPQMEEDKLTEEREFWTTLPTKQNIFLNKEYFVYKFNMTNENIKEKDTKEEKKEEEKKRKIEEEKDEKEGTEKTEKEGESLESKEEEQKQKDEL